MKQDNIYSFHKYPTIQTHEHILQNAEAYINQEDEHVIIAFEEGQDVMVKFLVMLVYYTKLEVHAKDNIQLQTRQ